MKIKTEINKKTEEAVGVRLADITKAGLYKRAVGVSLQRLLVLDHPGGHDLIKLYIDAYGVEGHFGGFGQDERMIPANETLTITIEG